MNTLAAIATLVGVTLAAQMETREPAFVERPGGLLACEEMPGFARVMRGPDPIIVPRADGSPTALCFVGFGVFAQRPMHLIYCDLVTGKTRTEALPEKFSNPWGSVWGPDGRLYFGLWGPATMLRYDPATDKVDQFGIMEPDPPYKGVPILTVGTDEKVYAIAGGWVFSIDPATDKVARYGHQGPKRRYPIAYTGSLAVDDGYIYSTFGNVASEIFTAATNKATGEQTLLADIQGARFAQGRLGVTARHNNQDYWMVKGKPILRQAPDEKPPWPERPLAERKPPPVLKGKPQFVAGLRDADGTCKVSYRLNPDQAWQTLTLSLPSDPVALSRIFTLPDGRVVASTAGYEGLVSFDPKTRAFSHLGMIGLSHYSTLVAGDKVYLAGYPGGNGCYVWDPSKPWTIGLGTPEKPALPDSDPASNPMRLDPWDKPGNFQFPLFFIQAGDKALYVACHGERSDVGGLLSWRELDTGKRGFLREPFELYDPCGLCTALGGTKIGLPTFSVKGGKGEPKPQSGRLFVIDVATRQVEWFIDPLPGVDCAGFVVEVKPGKLVLATDHRTGWSFNRYDEGEHQGGFLYTVDMNSRKVTRIIKLPGVLASRREYFWHVDFKLGPDEMIYTFYDDLLVRIDPDTLAMTALSRVGKTGCIAFCGNDIYMSGTPHFRRVAGALMAPKP